MPFYLLRLIIEILSDRKIRIKARNSTTKLNAIKCGVPQRVFLNPTLFSLYINDTLGRNKKGTENTVIFTDNLDYFLFFTQNIRQNQLMLTQFSSSYMEFTRTNKVKSDEINLN
jgi:hypothetical protein